MAAAPAAPAASANAGRRKAGPLDTLPPICGGAFVTSIVMYPADVVRAICMSNPGTGAGAALKGFLEAHGVMGFVKQGLVAEVTKACTASRRRRALPSPRALPAPSARFRR